MAGVAYPRDRAFVVQFCIDTDPAHDRMVGRAEHVESGQRRSFDSMEELEAFVREVLVEPALVIPLTPRDSGNDDEEP